MTTRRRKAPHVTPLIPAIDYDEAIIKRAEEIAAHRADRAHPDDYPQRVAASLEEHIAIGRERVEEWRLLGNHYADVMANPKTPAALVGALGAEMQALAERAGLNITSPEVVRLLYPMLRDRARRREARER